MRRAHRLGLEVDRVEVEVTTVERRLARVHSSRSTVTASSVRENLVRRSSPAGELTLEPARRPRGDARARRRARRGW